MSSFSEMRMFLEVAEAGSFSAAGRRMNRTPSSVSKIIARLETRLDVRLFDRIAGAIRLTQEGQAFKISCQQILVAVSEAESALAQHAGEVSGLVRVHTSLTFAKYELVPRLPDLLQRHPGLRIEFIIGTNRGDFLERDIDVAIHSGSPTELSLVGKPLFVREWVIAASPAYLQRFGAPLTPDDLLTHRCLNFTVRTQWNTWAFVEADVERTICPPVGQVRADQGELLQSLALHGLGIVRLARFHLSADLAAGRLIELLADYQPATQDTMYLLYPQGRSLAPRVRAFTDFLLQQYSKSPSL